jgi:imidazolonepropionase-like amidohydrolase
MDDSVGVIAKGKLADLIIVDGDPVKNISDIRRASLTMKNGVIYDPAKVNAAMGVKPIR